MILDSYRTVHLDLGSCVVREWTLDDKASLLHHANNRNVWRNLTHVFPHPYTDADAQWWFDFLARLPQPTHFAIDVQGCAVGGIGFSRGEGIFAASAELGSWLGEPYWGRGIMSAAVPAVSAYAFSRFELHRLEAAVFAWNAASMRILEKSGFVREGVLRRSAVKDGEVIDRVMYALTDLPERPSTEQQRRTDSSLDP